ncbi:MAG: capsid protein [Sanya Iflavirus 6]|nr:MAG: capsid protein [Sanya Iflavirus 6]
MNSQTCETPLLEIPSKTTPTSSLSYYEGDLSLGYVAEPSVWRSNFKLTGSAWERVPPPHGSVVDTDFINSLNNKRRWECPYYVRELCEFDLRIKRIRDWVPTVKVTPVKARPYRADPKDLPWKERFLHWATKAYKNKSSLFKVDFKKYFNRNPYNRIVLRKIARQERRNDERRNARLVAKRDLQEEKSRLRQGFLAIQPADAGEFVPSCVDDGEECEYIPNIRQPPTDDESWYNPNGLYIPEAVSSKPKLSSVRRVWKTIWQSIAKIIAARREGEFTNKPPFYVHTTEPAFQRWAELQYQVHNLDRNNLSPKPTQKTVNQSETARTVEVNVECSEKGNTIFMEQSGVSQGQTNVATTSKMVNLIPETNRFSALSSREIVLETFRWQNEEPGTKLREYSLPAALVKLRQPNPTAVPFQIHTFSNCDFIIRVRANPSQFQSGQLQCSWLYDPSADVNIKNRLNVYSLSQTNHCLVNAGTGNIGEIHVKYINPLSTLPAISSDLTDDSLNLGKFYIFVLNKLQCPDTVAKECEVTVSIELLNATYSGSKDYAVGKFVYPQAAVGAMAATIVAEKLLENTNTPNNDNPPYQGSRIAMVPQSNQSFCLGNSLPEPTNALRLDAVGQHKSVITGPNEMTVDYVSKVYGLVAIKEWTNKQHNGDKIHSFDASPLFDKKEYEGLTLGTDTAYKVPPVGVLSSLYSYWSGELRMRIDFVASRFHTGRLLLCYVPLYLDDITLDQAYSYPYQLFDLREGNQSVTFNIPYMSMLPMYPRRAGYTNQNDKYVPPGRVHIFVVNSLVSISNISDHVELNIYWGAGDNFNVFVPAQPSLITSFFPDNVKPSTDIKADPGMFPWYMGNDYEVAQYVGNGGLFIPAIARYSAFPDRISTFSNLKYGYYYKFKNAKSTHYATMGYWEPGSANKLKEEANDYYSKLFWVPIYSINDDTYSDYKGRILGACRTIDDVKAYYKDTGSEQKPNSLGLTHLLGITDFATSGYTENNPVFEGNIVPPNDFEVITTNQVDERVVGGPDEEIYAACKVYPIAAQLNKDLVGEKFGDLKTYCRRYQPYGLTKVVSTETYGDAMCTFPALPTGLDIDLTVSASNYPRYIREGPLQVILSGFRYYSGGMRFAIATTSAQFTMWVQHRADYEGNNRIETLTNTKTSANLLNAGYAQYLQSLKVNNIVQVEVPYYKNRNCLYAQRVNRKLKRTNGATSLGQLYVGIEGSKKDEKMVLTIFSSVADDFQAYVFQGFPPMIFVDDLQRNTTQSFTRMAQHQMFSVGLNQKQINDVTDQVLTKVNRSVEENLKKFVESAEKIKPDFSGITNITNSLFADIIGHVGHCLISPTKRSICWAFVHMFLKYGLIVDGGQTHLLSKVISPISKLFSNLPDARNNDVSPSPPTQSVNAGDDDEILSWYSRYAKKHNITTNQAPNSSELLTAGLELSSIIFSMIAGMHGLKSDNLSMFNPRKFSRIILESVTAGSRTYRFVLPFFKAVHEVVMKSIEWVTLYKNPHLIFINAVQKELPLIAEWHERVEEIVDARNEEKVLAQDSPWCEIVEEAYVMGVQLGKMYMKFIEGETDQSVDLKHGHTMFMKTFTELCRVRNDMLKRGLSSINRREPFCIWVAGKAGIGKSQLAQRLIPDMLRTCKIPYKGEHTFTIQSGVEYWNGVGTQPCILLDDFLAVDCGQMKDQALSDYMRIKSPSTLNPNMASLHDKNLRISPELFYINCNQIYPRPVGVSPEAFLTTKRYCHRS